MPNSPAATATVQSTALPTATLTIASSPSPAAGPNGSAALPRTPDTTGADPAELENAFLANVDDLLAEIADLTTAPCEDLRLAASENPTLVPTIRGFASTIKRVGNSQASLDTEAVKAALADLDQSLAQLDGALKLCGITISQP